MARRCLIVLVPFVVLSGVSLWGQHVVRVSVGASGTQGDLASGSPSISADGRYVAFSSDATNLVHGDSNGTTDIFLRDRLQGVTTRVTLSPAGLPANGRSVAPSISADGRFVTFLSDASNLVPADTNGVGDVFVRDVLAGTTLRVSVGQAGEQANGRSLNAVMTPDGRYVSFDSSATNLVALDTNGHDDVFVRDLLSGETLLVSVDANGVQGTKDSYQATISADGRRVAFQTQARFSPLDGDRLDDVYVRDIEAGTLALATISSTGVKSNLGGGFPSINAAGDKVVFVSSSSNLVADDTNGMSDVFIHDLANGATTRGSLDREFGQSYGHSSYGALSPDGHFLVFSSDATDLTPLDFNSLPDLFVRDLGSGRIERVTASSRGQAANAPSFFADISADSTHIAFDSGADRLVPGDSNGAGDVFVFSFTKYRHR